MITDQEQKSLDKMYEDFMANLKTTSSVLYYQLRSKEIPVKESK